jgi:hypothetical protein
MRPAQLDRRVVARCKRFRHEGLNLALLRHSIFAKCIESEK